MSTDSSTPHPTGPTAPSPPEFAPFAPPYPRPMVWLLAALGGVVFTLWLLGTPPLLWDKAGAVGYAICHRIDERSFHTHDHQLPLCARCTGIYLGVLTGLAFFAARGRLRAARLPNVYVLAVMVLLGMGYAFDGLNSYLSLFDAYTPVYQPHNTLRLLTGLIFGLDMIVVVLPVFNALTWHAPQLTLPPLDGLRDLVLLLTLAGGVGGLVLLQIDVVLIAAGVLSAFGVVLMFALVGGATFITLTRRDNSLVTWRDLIVPLLAGLTFAFFVIGGIDAARYVFTGTWDGFALPG
jgi:uncharacterized membrane protein